MVEFLGRYQSSSSILISKNLRDRYCKGAVRFLEAIGTNFQPSPLEPECLSPAGSAVTQNSGTTGEQGSVVLSGQEFHVTTLELVDSCRLPHAR